MTIGIYYRFLRLTSLSTLIFTPLICLSGQKLLVTFWCKTAAQYTTIRGCVYRTVIASEK